MTFEERLLKTGKKTLAVLGVFFGIGFTVGFLTGLGYGYAGNRAPAAQEDAGERQQDTPSEPLPAYDDAPTDDNAGVGLAAIRDASEELSVAEHELGDDENGFFISGKVVNHSQRAYDAVQVAFELCDARGNRYATVTDRTTERMESGDAWGFVVYIPYDQAPFFHSYRLQGIMAVTKQSAGS